jgi:hypothetical protein
MRQDDGGGKDRPPPPAFRPLHIIYCQWNITDRVPSESSIEKNTYKLYELSREKK